MEYINYSFYYRYILDGIGEYIEDSIYESEDEEAIEFFISNLCSTNIENVISMFK